MEKYRILGLAECVGKLGGGPVNVAALARREFVDPGEKGYSLSDKLGLSMKAWMYICSVPVVAIGNELAANCTLRDRERSYPTSDRDVGTARWAKLLRMFAETDGTPEDAVRCWIELTCPPKSAPEGWGERLIALLRVNSILFGGKRNE